jgi:hypothetical protein
MAPTGIPPQPADSKGTKWVFNPPPSWPTPPIGWQPASGWQPDPSWPDAPADWKFWRPEEGPERHRVSTFIKAFRPRRVRPARQSGVSAWWIAATILLCLAGIWTVSLSVIDDTQSAKFWNSVVFQDLANIGTFAAAAAAWLSATVVLRKSRKNAENRAADDPGNSTDSPDSSGMTKDDLEFIRTLIAQLSAGDLTESQVHRLERVIKALKAQPKIESSNGSDKPISRNAKRDA